MVTSSPTVVGKIAVVEDEGRRALRWETPGSYATLQRSIQLEPNALYRLEGWTRGDAAISLRARTRKTADQETSDAYTVTSAPSEDYVYRSVVFPTGEDGSALIILGATEATGVGTVYLAGLTIAREAAAEAAGPAIALTPGEKKKLCQKEGAAGSFAKNILAASTLSLNGFIFRPPEIIS